MSAIVHVGNVLDILPTLDAESVNCVVTSPPYWGLRSYLPADDEMKHAELGCEATPELYVANMVAVFREVKRVLRDDGTVWLNLGSSYASSRPARNAGACDTDGTRRSDSTAPDRVCPHSDGERPDELSRHMTHSVQVHREDGVRPCMTARDTSLADYAEASPDASLPDARVSMRRASSGQPSEDACDRPCSALEPPSTQTTSGHDSQPSARMGPNMGDTSEKSSPSDCRTLDMEPSDSACGDPSCRGRCGICWAHYTIPSLRFKAKDLVPTPWLVALALQADGWWLRSDVIWSKPNPMPSSVTDRCTVSHEYLFMLTKSARYYFDADAVREEASAATWADARTGTERVADFDRAATAFGAGTSASRRMARNAVGDPAAGRNRRTVWTIATQPYPEAHFATYPEKLVEPCVLAGCPAQVCSECGAPWERVVERIGLVSSGPNAIAEKPRSQNRNPSATALESRPIDGYGDLPKWDTRTTGWRPTCICDAPTVPGTVLDPFTGSGTTGAVACRLGRNFVGIELSPEYAEMAERRIAPHRDQMQLVVT